MAVRIPLQASPAACAALGSKGLPRALGVLLRSGVRAVLAEQGVSRAEVSLTLLGDDEIASLNREYLGHEGPTDVLSFALYEAGEPVLGDIYLGVPSARAEAEARGLPLAHELLRLAVHGTLHLLGHDHPTGQGRTRSRMWRLQERIVAEVLAP